MPAQHSSEQLVHDLCTKSFFSLWSYLNPLREDGSELCDILVKFRDDLIIFSVKDIRFNEDANDYHVAADRWTRRAVDQSIKQILGAERHLLNKGSFRVKAMADGELFEITNIEELRIHRISISLGSRGMIPVSEGWQDGKFIHVLTEEGFEVLFKELDTISDFVEYVSAREDFFVNRCRSLTFHSEGDLLMLYLQGNGQFPDYSDKTAVYLHDAGYEEFLKSPEYKSKKKADEPSYLVDHIINEFITHYNAGTLVAKTSLENHEKILAELASEDRLARRGLGRSILTIATSSLPEGAHAARLYCNSPDSPDKVYVIIGVPRATTREDRDTILAARCHVAVGLLRKRLNRLLAIGIATELHDETGGHSYDYMYYPKDHWDEDDQKAMENLQHDFGIWTVGKWMEEQEDEYPTQDAE